MIIPEKKKITTLILSKMKDGAESRMPIANQAEANPEADQPLTVAAQDIMLAIKDNKIIDLKNALKAFFDIHDSGQDDEKEE
jgi:hypothetical protein